MKIMKTIKILSVLLTIGFLYALPKDVQSQDVASKEVVYKSDIKGTACANKVSETLMQEKGVEHTYVDLETKTIKVKYNPEATSKATIQKAINDAGYVAEDTKVYKGKASNCCGEKKTKK